MTITRYTIGCAGGMVEDPAGEYVRYADVVTGDSAIVAIAEVNRLIAADNVLTWLEQNVSHLEHGGPGLEDGYWPHTAEDVDPFCNFAGLTLREYIARRQAGERDTEVKTGDWRMTVSKNAPERPPLDQSLVSAATHAKRRNRTFTEAGEILNAQRQISGAEKEMT